MNRDARISMEPVFLTGQAGPLFAVHFKPPAEADIGADLVYVPPFAEEMNRSRRMVAVQARSLAGCGIGVLVLDLYGTGDSGGDFVAARWPIWQGDVKVAMDWTEHNGRRLLGLWGLRLGALLAAQVAVTQTERPSRLVLWHPVIEGSALLNQFLRIRVAASMAGKERESGQALRTELSMGRSLEIAGYQLAPELATAVDSARLDGCSFPAGSRIDWIEIGDEQIGSVMPANRQHIIEGWRKQGATVSMSSVVAPPFWANEEAPPSEKLVALTRSLFTTCAA